jgi:hypothetical protein
MASDTNTSRSAVEDSEFVQQLFRGPFVPEEGTNLRRMLMGQEVLHVPDRLAQARQGGPWRPFFNVGARTMLRCR